jgi:hypothetical protein
MKTFSSAFLENCGRGLGRSHAPERRPTTKRHKTTDARVATTTTSTTTTSNNNDRLVSFLNAIHDKKKLREKTCVQLKVASVADPAPKKKNMPR